MGILDNARYAEIGKKSEAKKLVDTAINAAAPKIAEATLREHGPTIERIAERKTFNKYGPVIHKRAVGETLANLGIGISNSGNGLSSLGFS